MTKFLGLLLIFALCSIGLQGQETWRRSFGGAGSDSGRDIVDADGGYLAIGSTGSFGNGGDVYAVRMMNDGSPVWTSYYGGDGVQVGKGAIPVEDGFWIAGSTSNGGQGGYDMLLISIDQSGATNWVRTYGSDDWDFCNDMIPFNAGALLVGSTYSTGDQVPFLIHVDLNGDEVWSQSLDQSGEILGVSACDDGGFIVSGRLGDLSTDSTRSFVARFDQNGGMVWLTDFDPGGISYAHSVVQMTNGTFVSSGGTRNGEDHMQIQAQEFTAEGILGWNSRYGSGGDFEGRGIVETQDQGFGIAGYNAVFSAGGRDMYLLRADPNGDFLFGKNYGGGGDDEGYSVIQGTDGGFLVIGEARSHGPGIQSLFVVKTFEDGETEVDEVIQYFDPVSVPSLNSQPPQSISPCPALAGTSVSIGQGRTDLRSYRLMNMQGQVVDAGRVIDGSIFLRADLRGAYVLEVLDLQGMRSRFRAIIAGN